MDLRVAWKRLAIRLTSKLIVWRRIN